MPKPYTNNFNKFSPLDYENRSFNKKFRALKKYCPQAYKYVLFNLKNKYASQVDGIHEIDLPTTKEFKFVYGQIKLIYQKKNKKFKFIDLKPTDFFVDGYNFELETYKSVFYRNEIDKFKIDLFMKIKEVKNE